MGETLSVEGLLNMGRAFSEPAAVGTDRTLPTGALKTGGAFSEEEGWRMDEALSEEGLLASEAG